MHSEVCVLPGHVLIGPGPLLQVGRVPVIRQGGRMLLRHVLQDGNAAEKQKQTKKISLKTAETFGLKKKEKNLIISY